MKKLVLIAVMCFFSGLVFSAEIVINSKGQAVRLNDDQTWEVVDVADEDGKVVFKIISAKQYETAPGEFVQVKKDDFGTIEEYTYYFGATYEVEISNKMDYPVKINFMGLWSTLEWEYGHILATDLVKRLIRPGESVSKEFNMIFVEITKVELSASEIDDYHAKYGLDALENTLSVMEYVGAGLESFVFPPDANISKDAIGHFLMGSDKGVVPLKKEVCFGCKR